MVLLLIWSLLEWDTGSVQFHVAVLYKSGNQDKGHSITGYVYATCIFSRKTIFTFIDQYMIFMVKDKDKDLNFRLKWDL